MAIDAQQHELLLQQQQDFPWQHGQWQRQVVVSVTSAAPVAPVCIAWQLQPGSKCPVGLMQPETERPLIKAIGIIAQIIVA
ncbi:MAG TPA: hypothetical protein VGJ04_09110 [Pirellulales bacterium]